MHCAACTVPEPALPDLRAWILAGGGDQTAGGGSDQTGGGGGGQTAGGGGQTEGCAARGSA